jgi:hypothetical protein
MMHKATREDGDQRIMWDRNNADEVTSARRTFRELTGKGYSAFVAEGKKGDQGKRLTEFDPDAERIILVRPNQGG